jgi:hypothetical protein
MDKKKILMIFAIAIAVFGLIIAIIAIMAISNNNENNNKETPDAPRPVITLTQDGEDKVIISIESEVAISNVIYNWNSESAETIAETGKTQIEESISMPVGENTLNVSVIDSNGIETKTQKTFVLEASKPRIGDVIKIGNKIKISVTSETDLSYVSYKWNSDQEVKEDMYTYEDKTKYENTVEIPIGKNTLKIEAEDVNGKKSEKTMELTAYVKSYTEVIADNGYFDFTVTGTDDIEKVEFTINNKNYVMDANTFGQTKVVHYRVKLENGWNYLKITSTTVNKAVDTTYWKCEYKAPGVNIYLIKQMRR